MIFQLAGLRWFFDHAETISERNIERVRALGGGIAIQDRMAFQGEYFVARYGAAAAQTTPPIQRMLAMGIPVGAGTDATRVSSYNPWTSLYWLASGRTVGGLALYGDDHRLSREQALELWTLGSAWFSAEQGKKGAIRAGQLADLAVLSADFFTVPEAAIKDIESVLTVVGGRIVHAAGEFATLDPPPLPVLPEWSPVAIAPGHHRPMARMAHHHHASGQSCAIHGHPPDRAWRSNVPTSDFSGFWGALGCSCFAF
jgi:hypothetical protein